VPIFPLHQTCLGLEHPDGYITYWLLIVLPLGIIDAAHIFTGLASPLNPIRPEAHTSYEKFKGRFGQFFCTQLIVTA
jgi:hypothetical protein